MGFHGVVISTVSSSIPGMVFVVPSLFTISITVVLFRMDQSYVCDVVSYLFILFIHLYISQLWSSIKIFCISAGGRSPGVSQAHFFGWK